MHGGTFVGAVAIVALLAAPAQAFADETDNFTCRTRPLRDSQAALDGWVNDKIQEAVERANRRGAACDGACLFQELQRTVGGNVRHPVTWIPHASLARWIGRQSDLDTCHLRFRESVYGARPYDQPWLFPFTHRIIFLADSIRLAGRVVGTDKLNHFIREGLAHWRAVHEHQRDIAAILQQELGSSRSRLRMTEFGLKGRALTGVVSYADLAASHSGFVFWSDLLSLGRAESLVGYDAADRRFSQRRAFTFAAYVNDAWDEAINCSAFHPTLARQVARAQQRLALTCPVADWRPLAALPRSELYVNPELSER